MAKKKRSGGKKNSGIIGKILRTTGKILLRLAVIFVAASVLSVLAFRWIPVKYTPLMFQRYFENFGNDNYHARKKWKPIEKINSEMVLAVLASEDSRFMEHSGFDWDAIRKAREHNKRSENKYGASTITQQTAKNVFLLPSRTWLRKGLEAYFTFLIELMWSKERILEVYLNVIEVGQGLYGVEAAAEYYFDKPAVRLTRNEAAKIASILPNPQTWDLSNPGPKLLRRQERIRAGMSHLYLPEGINAAR